MKLVNYRTGNNSREYYKATIVYDKDFGFNTSRNE